LTKSSINSTTIAPGVVVYHKAFEASSIYKHIKNEKDNWEPGEAAGSRYSKPENYGVEILRDVNTIFFECDDQFGQHLENLTSIYKKDYISRYGIDTLKNFSGVYHMLKYTTGQHFKSHVDSVPEENRQISTTYYFNDDYEGGELYFTEFDLKYKPAAGDYLVFPSIWPYKHEAMPILSGVKYAFVQFLA
jgi:hypothetical protein